MQYFDLTVDQVCQKLGSDSKQGLSSEEVRKRQAKYGQNIILEEKKHLVILKFFAQFKDLFAIILLVAALLSYLAEAKLNAIIILGIVLLNATIGFFQEYRAERAVQALKKLLPSYTKVVRDGDEKKVLVSEIVPGDLVILEEGDTVPADARLVEEYELTTNNATLTGESRPKRKTDKPIFRRHVQITDVPNLVFMGTDITYGQGQAVVTAISMNTEFGKIAHLTQQIGIEYSPLQIQLFKLAKLVAKIAVAIGILGIGIGWLSGEPLVEMFLFALGVMVAVVPEGLPATVSVALAAGVQRMARRKALLKRLSAVETLGSTTVICTDKTGTLTKGEITVKELWMPGQSVSVTGSGYGPTGDFFINDKKVTIKDSDQLNLIFKISALCNNSKLISPTGSHKKWSIIGDPTEGTLLTLINKAGIDQKKLLEENPRIFELSFSSIRKRMSSIHKDKNGDIQAYIKGAPESILKCCTHIMIDGKREKITDKQKKEILAKNDELAKKAYRVLAFAWRDLSDKKIHYTIENVEHDLTFVGLCGMIDPPREEVPKAVKITYKAGIKIIMITGDYGLTAKAIAKQIGIASDDTEIIEGEEIDKLSDQELKKKLDQQHIIFARVSPTHKMRIVTLLKEKDEVVAVTGDGVNDAPALKSADIGVAMGITGTDVSKESAEMILLDDSFATITAAVEEGRRIFDNIKKFNLLLFSTNTGELFSVVFGVLLFIPLPITAIQILSIDLGAEVLPALALGVEPAEEGIMDHPPRPRHESFLNKKVLWHMFKIGIIIAGGAVLAFIVTLLQGGWHYGQNLSEMAPLYFKATTVTFSALVIGQLVNSLCARSEHESLFKLGLRSNKYSIGAIFVSTLLLLIIAYIPAINKLWHTAPIDGIGWLLILGTGLALFISEEIRKLILRKRLRTQAKN
jgi:potassium/sodium efflux P-type ATPase